MENSEVAKKVNGMIKDVKEYLLTETTRLYNSGAVDVSQYKDDFVLPKMLLHVALLNCAQQYEPFDASSLAKEIENLKHF